jgi:hypothetical protein
VPELVLAWVVGEGETDGDRVFLDKAEGFRAADLEQLPTIEGVERVWARDASIGKGASGPGAAVVFEVAQQVLEDVSALVGLGLGVREIIRILSGRRGRPPASLNEAALAAIAAAAHADALDGTYYLRTVPLSVEPGLGTDERDVWASCFDAPDTGTLHVVLMSPSGLVLGYIQVPVAWYFVHGELRQRDTDDIARWWEDQQPQAP